MSAKAQGGSWNALESKSLWRTNLYFKLLRRYLQTQVNYVLIQAVRTVVVSTKKISTAALAVAQTTRYIFWFSRHVDTLRNRCLGNNVQDTPPPPPCREGENRERIRDVPSHVRYSATVYSYTIRDVLS